MTRSPTARSRRWSVGLAALWLVVVPVAAVLGVLGLRAAGAGADPSAVISAADAVALATTASPAPTARPTPTAAPSPSGSPATPPAGSVVERRVPGAVLGLRCDAAVARLVWAVPEPGWFVEDAEVEDGLLVVRLEGPEGEVRALVSCGDGQPTVVGVQRRGDRDE